MVNKIKTVAPDCWWSPYSPLACTQRKDDKPGAFKKVPEEAGQNVNFINLHS